MSHKKTDILLFGLGLVATAFALTAYFQMREQAPKSHLEIKQELQLVAVINEFDCVECIRKVLCYWRILEQDFMDQNIDVRLLFSSENKDEFNQEELRHLCEPPISFELVDLAAFRGSKIMPMTTPSIMLTNGEHILCMEPIFANSDISAIHQRLNMTVAEFLPRAR